VVHKLGRGILSIIRLAQEHNMKGNVAIKVCTASSIPLEVSVFEKFGTRNKPQALAWENNDFWVLDRI
jgi:hypothetical protein